MQACTSPISRDAPTGEGEGRGKVGTVGDVVLEIGTGGSATLISKKIGKLLGAANKIRLNF